MTFIKNNGSWVENPATFVKHNGSWVENPSTWVKHNGSWVEISTGGGGGGGGGSAEAVYICVYTDIYKSTDGGPFLISPKPIGVTDVYDIACSNDGTVLYTIGKTNSGYVNMYKSTNSGESWAKNYEFSGTTLRGDGITCSADGQYVYAASYNGSGSEVIRSSNGGSTFTDVASESNPIDDVACNDAGGVIYYSVYDGMYKSVNGGNTFSELTGIDRPATMDCSGDGSIVYALSNDDNFLYKSTNGGSSWTKLSIETYNLALACTRSGEYVGLVDESEYYESTDGGTTFTDVGPTPIPAHFGGMAVVG